MDDNDLDGDENGRISVTLPRRLRAKLREVAAADDRPVSAVARKLLTRALSDSDDQGGGLAA
jgi:plasmid stability protein